ncbi:MAG: amino acid adenylation domain-containing protein, partial [Deltaproteobacteria bacterium]|nr:amino acid adenylation domain-containing protein [Deltaproteobacteria bacterium]
MDHRFSYSNMTEADSPDVCIHQRFEYQALKHPDATAVLLDAHRLTYNELNQKANQLARYLRQIDVGEGTLIGLFVERSLDVITAILGVLKNGCAYVPLDPAYPEERLRHMINDCAFPVILTLSHLREMLPQTGARIVCIDSEWGRIAQEKSDNPLSGRGPESLAYVIFTSGSTGRPKGVCCHHRGVMNLLSDFQNRQPLGPGDICSWWTSLNFDVSVYEIFSPLMEGATLTIVPEPMRADAPTLMEWLHREEVTSAYLPPFMVADLDVSLREHPRKSVLRRLLVGVEAIPERLLNAIDRAVPDLHIINGYGPTEATVCATLYPISPENELHENTPIGRPVQNMQVYLLDEAGQQVPEGSSGELCIGGVGVAVGYLNRPDLTAERFIRDPFSSKNGAKLYRTGDLARLMPDGNMEFLGRADFQVKFHGFRVELGEIEAHLRKYPAIREAVVLALEDIPGVKRLVAYVVCYKGQEVSTQDLRESLKRSLPDYMVPSIFVALDRIPMTPNGKTDRSALPPPDGFNQLTAGGHAYCEPRTPVEKQLARFFAEVLHREPIGLNDSFFELGGHSLLATQVVSRIRESFKVDLPVSAIFKAPTVEALARFVDGSGHEVQSTELPPIAHMEDDTTAPLSFSQLRQWYLDQLEPGTPAYNIPLAYRLKGPLDETAMVTAFEKIITRHQGLRTLFKKRDGQPVQIIESIQSFAPEIIDLRHVPEAERETEARTLCNQECHRGFDLSKDLLLRVLLLRLDLDNHVLMLTVHHIVSDGWSMGVIFREFMTLYDGYASGRSPDLPGLPIHYTDFARWQRKWMESETIRPQVDFWKHQLKGTPEGIDLPTDRPRPAVQSYRGASESIFLETELCEAIKSLTRKKGVTLFMLMLAALKTLLYRYSRQGDISVGTFIANRNRADIEGLVGFFINTLVMRTDLSDNPSFETLLDRVRETCLSAYAHQDLPFEKLLDEVKPERNLSRTPLFQVMMVLQNMPLPPLNLQGMACAPMELETFRSNFDLTLWLYERGTETAPEIKMVLDYSTDLFDGTTIKQMLTCLRNLLVDAAADPSRRLSDLSILSEEERAYILSRWSGAAPYQPGPDVCVHQLFEEQALNRPDAIALTEPDGKRGEHKGHSYRDLNQDANRLAHFLRKCGITPDTLVGILMERSRYLITAILGILKAGGAYLPIDPICPADRLAFILNDAGSPVVLTDTHTVHRIEEMTGTELLNEDLRIVVLDRDWEEIRRESPDNLSESAGGTNLAYAIYTSGSTGQPKGVLIEHKALSAFVNSAVQEYRIQPDDRILQFASPSFDASVEEIFTSLTTGATLILRSDEMIRSMPAFVRACHDNHLTVVDLPTAF